MININLGCGMDKKEGYDNIDVSSECNPDLMFDIEDGIPYSDSCVKEILAYNVLEQVSSPKKYVFVMNELWRVLEKNGRLMVRVPDAAKIYAFQDPMDVMRFTDESFTYLQSTNPRYQEYGRLYGFKPWKVERIHSKNENQLEFMLMPIK